MQENGVDNRPIRIRIKDPVAKARLLALADDPDYDMNLREWVEWLLVKNLEENGIRYRRKV